MLMCRSYAVHSLLGVLGAEPGAFGARLCTQRRLSSSSPWPFGLRGGEIQGGSSRPTEQAFRCVTPGNDVLR